MKESLNQVVKIWDVGGLTDLVEGFLVCLKLGANGLSAIAAILVSTAGLHGLACGLLALGKVSGRVVVLLGLRHRSELGLHLFLDLSVLFK